MTIPRVGSVKHTALALVVAFLPVAGGPAEAAVEEREVEASGSGPTEDQAIMFALDQAVGMVNGLSIESKQWMAAAEESFSSDKGSSYSFAETASIDISTLTKGVISSYEVMTIVPEGGGYRARVKAKIAVFKRQSSANRRRIAVLPLRTRGDYAINGTYVDPRRLLDVAGQAIVNELVDSRRFTVLDRSYMEEVGGELEVVQRSDAPVADLARLGQSLTADYVLVGALDDLIGSTRTTRMRTRDIEIQTLEVNAQLSYRVIDPATKQVKFSRTEVATIADADLRGAGVKVGAGGATIGIASAKIIGEKVGIAVTEAIYPIMVTAVTSTGLVLGQGGESMSPGLVLDVFKRGERMLDPYTKESIGRVEEWIATVEITRSTNKQSYAKVIKSSDGELAEHFQPKTLIARRSGNVAKATQMDKERARITRVRKERDAEQEALW